MKSNRIFYLFFLALALLLFFPNLLQKGMFVDGLWYSTISKNMADGLGTFWSPCFTKTMYPVFNEHPPLVFGIQSVFFRVLGSSVYTEKIYALFVICMTFILINILWQSVFKDNDELRNVGFIPGILWILHETTYLYYPNNLLECTQGLFILISVILIIKGLQKENYSSYAFMFIAGISLMLSFLSKGFTGLYALITILLYHFLIRKIRICKLLAYHLILLAGLGMILLVYFFNTNASQNILSYIDTQVLAALKGERTENMHINRFYIVRRLIETSILPLILTILIAIISYFRHGTKNFLKYRKEFLFYTILGLSGVLPMMVSLKQGTYYLVTTIPYFSVALGLLLVSDLSWTDILRESKSFRVITWILLLFSITYSSFSINKINKRDRTTLTDLKQFENIVEDKATMGCITDKSELSLYGFFMRYYSISLDTASPYNYPLIVYDKELPFDTSLYQPLNLKTDKFDLLKKRKKED